MDDFLAVLRARPTVEFVLGSRGMPRRYYDYLPQFEQLHQISTIGSWVLGFGFVVQVRAGIDVELGEDGIGYLQLGMTRLPGAKSGSLPSVSYPRRDVATLSLGYRGRFH